MERSNKKVLLMGRAGAGKTSMRSIIFANYMAGDTKRLSATNRVEHSHLRFLGNLVLSLWDCGGQDSFMENYFESQREHIFRDVAVLIYVMEARGGATNTLQHQNRKNESEKDLNAFKNALQNIKKFSPHAKVFGLLHKMDLIRAADRPKLLIQFQEIIQNITSGNNFMLFGTSIWDETLFKAWSDIVYSLIPNIQILEHHLGLFCDASQASEIVLFEKSTFLVISHVTRKQQHDSHRFEKISNICKQFKLTCQKSQTSFSSMMLRNSSFICCIERFTQNTYILVVASDTDIEPAAILCNIDYARGNFERIAEGMGLNAT